MYKYVKNVGWSVPMITIIVGASYKLARPGRQAAQRPPSGRVGADSFSWEPTLILFPPVGKRNPYEIIQKIV
jgi:hypothetical protein